MAFELEDNDREWKEQVRKRETLEAFAGAFISGGSDDLHTVYIYKDGTLSELDFHSAEIPDAFKIESLLRGRLIELEGSSFAPGESDDGSLDVFKGVLGYRLSEKETEDGGKTIFAEWLYAVRPDDRLVVSPDLDFLKPFYGDALVSAAAGQDCADRGLYDMINNSAMDALGVSFKGYYENYIFTREDIAYLLDGHSITFSYIAGDGRIVTKTGYLRPVSFSDDITEAYENEEYSLPTRFVTAEFTEGENVYLEEFLKAAERSAAEQKIKEIYGL